MKMKMIAQIVVVMILKGEDDRVVEASVFVPCVNSSCHGNMNILVPLLSNSWLIG